MRPIDADAFDERIRAAGGMSEEELSEDFKDGVQTVLYMMSKQPTITAQPEETHDKRTETHKCDCISRADVEQTVEDNILCYTHSDRPIDQDPDTECHKAIRTALRMLRKDLRKLPSAQPDIKQAAKLLLDFIESCPGGDSYLITPDGEELRTDWGYAAEGIQLILDWAERRSDGEETDRKTNHFKTVDIYPQP